MFSEIHYSKELGAATYNGFDWGGLELVISFIDGEVKYSIQLIDED